uniref:Drf_GBD domain-containing protein n=1 Tax=Macrostomum lignano TaxID=282301 RepID=A0A1I8FUJ6_9PLAT
ALQLEARKLSGDDGVNTLLGDFGSTRLDTQELLMMLHYCSDEAKLVEIIHNNRQMIVDTGLAGPPGTAPAMRSSDLGEGGGAEQPERALIGRGAAAGGAEDVESEAFPVGRRRGL